MERDQNPVLCQNNTQIAATPQKNKETPSTISRDIQNIPTPFKNIPTPFKQAFYFPKAKQNLPKKK